MAIFSMYILTLVNLMFLFFLINHLIECYIKVCGGEDSLEHVSQCLRYQSAPSGVPTEQAQADYLS